MNHFGRLFQVSIFGESHGNAVGIVVDGVKPGIPLTEEDFISDLQRRKSGGLGTTPRVEADEVLIESGVFNNLTSLQDLFFLLLYTLLHSFLPSLLSIILEFSIQQTCFN